MLQDFQLFRLCCTCDILFTVPLGICFVVFSLQVGTGRGRGEWIEDEYFLNYLEGWEVVGRD